MGAEVWHGDQEAKKARSLTLKGGNRMTVTVNIKGKSYTWDKHQPNVWKTDKGNIVTSKKVLGQIAKEARAERPASQQQWQ